jgi:hypothetical protein
MRWRRFRSANLLSSIGMFCGISRSREPNTNRETSTSKIQETSIDRIVRTSDE